MKGPTANYYRIFTVEEYYFGVFCPSTYVGQHHFLISRLSAYNNFNPLTRNNFTLSPALKNAMIVDV